MSAPDLSNELMPQALLLSAPRDSSAPGIPAQPAVADKAALRWLYPFDYPLLAYVGIAVLVSTLLDRQPNWSSVLSFRTELLLISMGGPWVLAIAYGWLLVGLGLTLSQIASRTAEFCRETLLDWRRWYEMVRVVLAFKLCMVIYSALKSWIPLINPSLYDAALANIDQWLHFGVSPLDACLVVMEFPLVSRSVDLLYIVWYALKLPIMLFFLLHPSVWRRRHFFTVYLLVWMIGGSLAIVWPSLGPIYVNPEAFAHVEMPYARTLQEYLWNHYHALLSAPESHRSLLYDGVAAFPSLHVAIAVLHAVALRDSSRTLFWLLAVYAVVIQFGSVALGWHYAVDGYFGGLLAIGLYYGLKPLFASSACTAGLPDTSQLPEPR